MSPDPVGAPRRSRAVYPGTFDPFTAGHRDLVDRARRLFEHLTVLVAVNGEKQPARNGVERALVIRSSLPTDWENVTVTAWNGLTVDYCRRHGAGVIIRGARNAGDVVREYELAATNEALGGVATLLIPARPGLAAISSTVVRSAAT